MNLKIKGVQIDLVGQKETVEFVLSFIDFIKKCGFNTLVLYLEGRIKTPTFPFLSDKESYSPDEIKEIVKYGGKKKIDIIPVISTLGHTEMFLQFPQLRNLAELSGDTEGRWLKKGYYNMTCPLNEDVYKFFESYFSEVIPLFKSKYFHAGLDECFEIGMCEKCRKEGEKKGYHYLYSYHISRIYKIIKKFKKNMMMWDDMFEIYSESLENIPKDIIMCTWNYNYFVYKPLSHFSNYEREDVFKKYDKKGIKYLFCTKDALIPNIYSFTEYAKNYKPLGGLITKWERGRRFQFDCYPIVTFTGKLWNLKKEFNLESEIEKIMKEYAGKNREKIEALKKYYFSEIPSYSFSSSFIRGEIEPLEEQFYREAKLLYSILLGEKKETINEIVSILNDKIIKFEIRKALFEHLLNGKNKNNIENLLKRIEKIKKERLKMWEKYRKGIPSKIEKYYDSISENVIKFIKKAKESNYFLYLRFFLPDMHGSSFSTINVYDEIGNKIEVVKNVSFKPVHSSIPYYSFVIPFHSDKKVKNIELEVCGYGGQGITYLEVIDKKGNKFYPECITETSGIVENPADLLVDNLRWSYLGLREIKKMFNWNDFRKVKHTIKVKVKKDM